MYLSEQSRTSNLDNTDESSLSKVESSNGSKRGKPLPEWRKKVYHRAGTGDESEALREFYELAKSVYKRDKYTCQGCFKTLYRLHLIGRELTCHHIIPRAESGPNELRNLITLCGDCHTQVEESTKRTRGEIFGFNSEEQRHYSPRNKAEKSQWQRWVYGGYSPPWA